MILGEMKQTGDALFDRYSQAVAQGSPDAAAYYAAYVELLIKHFRLEHLRSDKVALSAELTRLTDAWGHDGLQNLRQLYPDHFANERKAVHPEILDAELLTSWEPEFGHDPRYWQLIHWCEAWRWLTDKELSHYEFRPEEFAPLITAYRRGIADLPTLLPLLEVYQIAEPDYASQQIEWREHSRQAEDEHEKQGGAPRWRDLRYEALPLSFFELQAAKAQDVLAELELNLDGFHDALVRLCPDWAQAWYQRAAHFARTGRARQAYADIAAGNACQINRATHLFPVALAFKQAMTGDVPGSLYLHWSIAMHSSSHTTIGVTMALRNLGSDLREEIPLPARLDVTQQRLKMQCRCTVADNVTPTEANHGLLVLVKILGGLAQQFESQGQPALIDQLKTLGTELRTEVMAFNKNRTDLSTIRSIDGSFRLTYEESQSVVMPLYQRNFDEFVEGRLWQESVVAPLIARIEALPITSLLDT